MSAAWRGYVLAAVIAAVVAIVSRPAFAANGRVALVRPSASTPAATEAMTRIQGELVADGFDVVILDAPPGDSESIAPQDAGVIASIELVVDAAGDAAELRVMDRLTNKTVIRRTTIGASESSTFAQVLAVRAVELLRASLLELLVQPKKQATADIPPPANNATGRASQWAAGALDVEEELTWAVDAGTAVILGFDGVGPALMGVLRLRRKVANPLEMRVTVAGLGTEPRVSRLTEGSAGVRQQIALFDFALTPWNRAVVHPIFSLGAGALYMSVDGSQAASIYQGQSDFTWAFAADAGTGLELRFSDRFQLSVEGHAFITRPYPVIRFLEHDVASLSQPSLLGTLTLVGWL